MLLADVGVEANSSAILRLLARLGNRPANAQAIDLESNRYGEQKIFDAVNPTAFIAPRTRFQSAS